MVLKQLKHIVLVCEGDVIEQASEIIDTAK